MKNVEEIDSVYTKELEICKRVGKEVCIDVSQCQLNKKDLTILLHQISKLGVSRKLCKFF